MNIPNIAGLVSVGKAFVTANRPELLLGMSLTGTLLSVVSAARGGYKSGQQVADAELGRSLEGMSPTSLADLEANLLKPENQLTSREKLNLTWINYLPAAAGTLGSMTATTGLHLVHVREKRMIAAACLMAIDEVKKEAGAYKKELSNLGFAMSDEPEALEAAADEDGVARHVDGEGVVEELYLVRDARTQRDIWSNKRRIDDAVNEVNAMLAAEGECSLNHFYSYAGLNDVPDGLDYGWAGGTKLALKWDTSIRDDGRPVRAFTFRPAPKTGL